MRRRAASGAALPGGFSLDRADCRLSAWAARRRIRPRREHEAPGLGSRCGLAEDEVTVYDGLGGAYIDAIVNSESVPGNPGASRSKPITENRSPACLTGPEPAGGYDCTGTLEIFTPRVIPSALATTCASDITGDGVVNFADLAKMKSVFFKTCAP